MSYEETLVCDGCSRVVDGGPRSNTLTTLKNIGGRAFVKGRHEWEEVPADEPWGRTKRHLCGDCAELAKFYDGEPVPGGGDE